MKKRWILLAGGVAVAVIAGTALWPSKHNPAGSATPPRKAALRVAEEAVDFGIIKSGVRRKYAITVRNTGQVPVSILNVRKSCVCAEVAYDFPKRDILPGCTATISCEFPIEVGYQSFALFVRFSDADVGRVVIKYYGTAQFTFSESRVKWDEIIQGRQSEERAITVYAESMYIDKSISICAVGNSPAWLKCQYLRAVAVSPQPKAGISGAKLTAGVLKFSVAHDAPLGKFSEALTLHIAVDDENHDVAFLCVGTVTREVYPTLETLTFFDSTTQAITFSIKSIGRPFTVTDIQTEMGRCETRKISERECQVSFTLAAQPNASTGSLILKLDHPAIKELSVPICIVGYR